MKSFSLLRQSTKGLLAPTALGLLLLMSGCASWNTNSGGKETWVGGGLVTVATESFQPVTPVTLNADTSKIYGSTGPSGKKVTLFWGLITLHHY